MKQDQPNVHFTIVIPTRDRHDVLQWCLESCLDQDYENYEVLVCDNFSSPETRSVIDSVNSPKVKYIRTERRLSMMDNWEFALSHVTDGYVTVVGDDNGLLPNCLSGIAKVIEEENLDVFHGALLQYHWPDHLDSNMRNLLSIPLDNNIRIINSKRALRLAFAGLMGFSILPTINNCFVRNDILNKIREKGNGKVFNSIVPDVYSSAAIAYFTDKYAFSEKPYSINGASRHSNGSGSNNRKEAYEIWKTENVGMQVHSNYIVTKSYYIAVSEAYEQAKTHLFPNDRRYSVNIKRMLHRAISEEFIGMGREWLEHDIIEVAKRNEIRIRIPHTRYKKDSSETNKQATMNLDFGTNTLQLNAAAFNVKNVHDAAILAHNIINGGVKIQDRFNGGLSILLRRIAKKIRLRWIEWKG